MASFNQVILVGNLTRDPHTKQIGNSSSVTEFGMACNRRFKTASGEEREEVTFVDCAAFGRQGETIKQYCTKGKPLFVQGRLKFDSWDQDGQKRSKLSVVVENFQFIGGRDGGGEQQGSAPSRGVNNLREQKRNASPAEMPFGANREFKDDDIPF